ncbi:hypothetical protein [Vacuolonema iberomarrocanum]|uniref:hypothetical protein n=1 Tax=Vacuolonema iberomarrocanum TaxID=3454632 RepID=UPI0019E0A32A|nr:hypothetical protein [filamentous cyanobacterium LEGE 07170]
MKYFFLSDGWRIGRVWELGGLWNEIGWRRRPDIQQLPISLLEKGETLWLYRVEDAVLMLEVMPKTDGTPVQEGIGQVILKRLISAEQVIEHLCSLNTEAIAHPSDLHTTQPQQI